MEVRCCCDAGKLLGWLPDPPKGFYKKTVRFLAGPEVDAPILEFEVDYVTLFTNPLRPHLAYKSRDYPIELLRKISEFKENTGETSFSPAEPIDLGPRGNGADGSPNNGCESRAGDASTNCSVPG